MAVEDKAAPASRHSFLDGGCQSPVVWVVEAFEKRVPFFGRWGCTEDLPLRASRVDHPHAMSCSRLQLVVLEALRIHNEAADGKYNFGCSWNQSAEQLIREVVGEPQEFIGNRVIIEQQSGSNVLRDAGRCMGYV